MFGSIAYFFFDNQGGSTIGVVWRADFRARLDGKEGTLKWSVKNSAFARPVHDAKGRIEGLKLHIEEILADMSKAGTGLVERIDTA
jgi:hypothetical protein